MKFILYKNEILLTLLTLGVVSLMILFNDINKEVRIKELKIFLQKSEREDNSLDHIGLVMKYRINKRLYEEQMSQEKADMIELRVSSLLSDTMQKKRVPLEQYEILAVPAIYTINFFRSIIGKEPIKDIKDSKSNVFLEIAYYYERNKYYEEALQIYNRALSEGNIDRTTTAGILLHRGFCHSIIGNFKEAKEDYNRIIKEFSDEKVSITAVILLKYLEGFRTEAVRVIKDEKDSIVKGEKLYKLIAYKESLRVLEKVEKDADPEEISRIRLVKARCFEELAEKEKAVNTYQKIIKEDRNSEYAKMANRRVFIIGSIAENGEKLKKMAVMNNEIIRDEGFDKMIDQVERLEKTKPELKEAEAEPFLKEEIKILEERPPVIDETKIETLEAIKPGEKKKDKEKKKQKRELVRQKIYTADGNVFVGAITNETGEAVYLKTMIGPVKIEKKKIAKRENL